MERKTTYLGVTTTTDIVKDRDELQRKAESGLITPRGYWSNLKATWNNMDRSDKAEDLAAIQ